MSKNERKYPKGYWMGVGLSIGVAIGVMLAHSLTTSASGLPLASLLDRASARHWNRETRTTSAL